MDIRIQLLSKTATQTRVAVSLTQDMGGLLYTKVLRSLHNNTQQPVVYLVEGKNVVLREYASDKGETSCAVFSRMSGTT